MSNIDDVIRELEETFVVDRAEVRAAILAEELNVAAQAVDYAKSISPTDTGAYKDDINVHQDGDNVWVGFDDPAAHIIEYGSVNSPEFAIRARTEEHFNQ